METDTIDWEGELSNVEGLITEEMNMMLLQPTSEEEIRVAVYQMAPTKALGLDGFSAIFFPKVQVYCQG